MKVIIKAMGQVSGGQNAEVFDKYVNFALLGMGRQILPECVSALVVLIPLLLNIFPALGPFTFSRLFVCLEL